MCRAQRRSVQTARRGSSGQTQSKNASVGRSCQNDCPSKQEPFPLRPLVVLFHPLFDLNLNLQDRKTKGKRPYASSLQAGSLTSRRFSRRRLPSSKSCRGHIAFHHRTARASRPEIQSLRRLQTRTHATSPAWRLGGRRSENQRTLAKQA